MRKPRRVLGYYQCYDECKCIEIRRVLVCFYFILTTMTSVQEFNCILCKETFENKEDLQIHFRYCNFLCHWIILQFDTTFHLFIQFVYHILTLENMVIRSLTKVQKRAGLKARPTLQLRKRVRLKWLAVMYALRCSLRYPRLSLTSTRCTQTTTRNTSVPGVGNSSLWRWVCTDVCICGQWHNNLCPSPPLSPYQLSAIYFSNQNCSIVQMFKIFSSVFLS